MSTKIEWCDRTWNPVTGCTKISEGCKNCYAELMSKRLAGRYGYPEAPHNFDVTWHPDKLEQPLHWRKPRRIFVCSMSDLFHVAVRPHWLQDIFAVIAECPQHTFQILTKRPGKMRTWLEWYGDVPDNVWLGVTAENQKQWAIRVGILRGIPAVVRFVSIEPMLSGIDMHMISASGYKTLSRWYGPNGFDETGSQPEKRRTISQIIVGAETGPGARPMDLDWARSVRDQCQVAGVPFFFKRDSDGNRELDGRLWEEFPG